MAAREIKTTLALDGEQKFKRAIAEATTTIRNMGTQLTLATAEFKRDGDAMKLIQQRSETLRAEMRQQEEIVRALEGAVKDSADKYGENSAQVEKWEAELNRAKARLANLQTEFANNEQGLDKNGKAFQEATQNAADFGEQMGEVQQAVSGITFQSVNTAIGNLQTTLKNAGKAVWDFSRGAWDLVADSSTWADDLITLSTQTGVSLHDLQGWRYAARFVDTEVDTIAKTMQKLVNPSKAVQEQLQAVGVAITSGGKQRDKQDIFWDTIQALGKMKDASEAESLANAVFGKSYQELIPLIQAGRKEWDAYVKEAQAGGYILGDEQVQKLGTFNDSLQEIDEAVSALKRHISSDLAEPLTGVADAFSSLVGSFIEWSQSAEGQAALGELASGITSVTQSLAEHTDFKKLAEAAGAAIKAIGDACVFAGEHPDVVLTGIAGALALWSGIKIEQSVLSVFEALKGLAPLWKGLQKVVPPLQNIGPALKTIGGAVAPFAIGAGVVGGMFLAANALDELAAERDFSWLVGLDNLSAGIDPTGVAAIKAGIQLGITQGIEAADVPGSITNKIKTEWETGFQQLQDSLAEDSTGGKAFSKGEMKKLTAWVEATLGEDVKSAQTKAKEMWQSVYDAAIGKGFTPTQAEEEADSLLAENPLVKTVNELTKTKAELDTAMENLYKAGNNATNEEIRKVSELMGKVRDLQEQLGVLQSDTAQYAERSYKLVIEGLGTAANVGAAITWVDELYNQEKAAADRAVKDAQDQYTVEAYDAMSKGDTDALAAAKEKLAKAQAETNAAYEEANENRIERINALLAGAGKVKPEDMEAWAESLETLSSAMDALRGNENGDALNLEAAAEAVRGADLEALREKYPKLQAWEIFKSTEPVDAEKLIEAWVTRPLTQAGIPNLMEAIWGQALGDVGEKAATNKTVLEAFQTMLDNGSLDGLDTSTYAGTLLNALRTQMLIEAQGEDGLLSRKEFLGVMDSEEWKNAGKNAAAGLGQGISENEDLATKPAQEAGEATLEAMQYALQEKSPSKATQKMGANLIAGLPLGIADALPSARDFAFDSGLSISDSLALGIESGFARIRTAINRMVALTQAAPILAGGLAGGGTVYGQTYNSNASMYIGQYNQYADSNVEEIMGIMADMQRQRNAGLGS